MLGVTTTRANAEPTAQERGLADTLFRDAKAMGTAGNVSPACLKFAESQRLASVAMTASSAQTPAQRRAMGAKSATGPPWW